jgi:hypothetical protein
MMDKYEDIYNKAIDDFLSVCQDALVNQETFNGFRYLLATKTNLIEHVTYEEGLEYIREISPNILERLDIFLTSDEIGSPISYYYEAINRRASTATLRYIKVLSDLIKYFGSLNNMDIVEIGSGYGGQCKIIYNYCHPRSYTLIDLSDVLALSYRFLNHFEIKRNIKLTGDYDLCISNYTFSEIDKKWQDIYNRDIIQKSRRGYMICNFTDLRKNSNAMTKNEILSLRPNSLEFPERPLTALDNFVYIWGINDKKYE